MNYEAQFPGPGPAPSKMREAARRIHIALSLEDDARLELAFGSLHFWHEGKEILAGSQLVEGGDSGECALRRGLSSLKSTVNSLSIAIQLIEEARAEVKASK